MSVPILELTQLKCESGLYLKIWYHNLSESLRTVDELEASKKSVPVFSLRYPNQIQLFNEKDRPLYVGVGLAYLMFSAKSRLIAVMSRFTNRVVWFGYHLILYEPAGSSLSVISGNSIMIPLTKKSRTHPYLSNRFTEGNKVSIQK